MTASETGSRLLALANFLYRACGLIMQRQTLSSAVIERLDSAIIGGTRSL